MISMFSFRKKVQIETVIEVPMPLTDHEQFLKELLDSHVKWNQAGKKEYADAYLLLLHNFTLPKDDAQEAEVV